MGAANDLSFRQSVARVSSLREAGLSSKTNLSADGALACGVSARD
jgi:hypothetical protein